MKESERKLIRSYFACVKDLRDKDIVRSDKVLGDLGEWVCAQKYNLILEKSGRHPGFDGKIRGKKVQVKAHNSPLGTNLSVGDPEKYDHLIVLIGPNSKLRVSHDGLSFHIYRFTSGKVKKLMKRNTGHYCAKGILEKESYDIVKI